MTAVTETASSPRDDRRFEELYASQFDFLVAVAVRKFRVPETEAENIAHEVFLTYLRHVGQIIEVEKWLLGAICHGSRYWWRQNGGRMQQLNDAKAVERPDPATTRILQSLPDQLAAREALERLPLRYQEILKLRYFQGFSVPELAAKLGLKPKYAQKLLTKCLRRAERDYRAKGRT